MKVVHYTSKDNGPKAQLKLYLWVHHSRWTWSVKYAWQNSESYLTSLPERVHSHRCSTWSWAATAAYTVARSTAESVCTSQSFPNVTWTTQNQTGGVWPSLAGLFLACPVMPPLQLPLSLPPSFPLFLPSFSLFLLLFLHEEPRAQLCPFSLAVIECMEWKG